MGCSCGGSLNRYRFNIQVNRCRIIASDSPARGPQLLIPQFPRRNDGEGFNFSKIEQFLVAGHEPNRFPGRWRTRDRDIAASLIGMEDFCVTRPLCLPLSAERGIRRQPLPADELLGEDPFKAPAALAAGQQLVS